jgi:hypothetical protein
MVRLLLVSAPDLGSSVAIFAGNGGASSKSPLLDPLPDSGPAMAERKGLMQPI